MLPSISRQFVSSVVPIAAGFLVGMLFVTMLGRFESKWALAFILLVAGVAAMQLLRIFRVSLQDTYLLSAAFLMPVVYDINFFYQDNPPFFVSANGFGINAADVFMGMLVGQRLLEGFFGQVRAEQAVPSSLLWIMGAVLLINSLSLVTTPFPFFAISMIWAQLKAYVVFYYIAGNVRSEKLLQRLAYVIVTVLAGQGLVALEQKFVGAIFTAERLGIATTLQSQVGGQILTRVSGTFGQPNALAMFINQLFFIGLFTTLIENNTKYKILMALGLAVALIAEIFTASRGGWVALVAAFFVCYLLWNKQRGRGLLLSLVSVGFVSLLAFSLLFVSSQTLRDRLLLDDHGTADVRKPLMDVAFNVIQQNPLSGVGLNQYTYFMAQYDRTLEAIASNYLYPVHNTYLLVAAETGVPNILLILLFITLVLWRGLKLFLRADGIVAAMTLGAIGGIISWMIHNLVDLTSIYEAYPFWVLFGLIIAMDRMVPLQAEPGQLSDPQASRRVLR
ncbi:O-antigen ligase family protein [Marinobacterium jannaschii]|uniref:O-antigen ligase family protein n=1 Tax=Marinobacterium jannaschii TaxID=64970 RepID=UPI0004852AB3|nr:O-antigen ligase family protein [Marinobacterium jannaschii]